MPHLLRRAIVLTLLVSGVAFSPAQADPSCDGDGLYRWCGDRVAPGRILHLSYDPRGAPSVAADAPSTIEAALDQWRRYWPMGGAPFPMTFGGTSSAGFAQDGRSTISWGAPSQCAGGGIAVACVWYRGTSGIAAQEIVEVDIVLDPARPWADHPDHSGQAVTGEYAGATGFPSAAWLDLRSTLVHELGHGLGLMHVGEGVFPSDLSAAGKHLQSMYRWLVPGSTHARSIDAGDIAGLQRIAVAMTTGA